MTRALSVVTILLVVSLAGAARASAQSPSEAVRAGMKVSITDDAGKQVVGRVDSISDDVIRIKGRTSSDEFSLPNIVRIEKPDSLRNGALTGLAVGASVGLLSTVAYGSRQHPEIIAWATFGNAVIYSALGTAIDAMVNTKRTLYERGRARQTRVAPLVGPRAAGAAVRVSW